MVTNNFDPTKYGATKFNPTSLGVTPVQETGQPVAKKGILQKTGEGFLDFIGMKGLRNLATSFVLTRDKEYRRIVDKIDKGGNATQGELAYLNSLNQSLTEVTPTAKQVAGSVLETGVTLATLGMGGGKLLPTMAKVAGAGAVSGAGSGLQENKSTEGVLRQAFTTGLTSVATYGVIAGISKLGKMALEKLPKKVYSSIANLDAETANTLMNEKQIGTLGKLNAISDSEIGKLNETIASKIETKNGKINTSKFLQGIKGEIMSKWQGATEKQVDAAIKRFKVAPLLEKNSIDFKVADNIRQGLGTELRTVWRMEDPKFTESVGKKLWQGLVNVIRPATDTTVEFNRLASYTKAAIKTSKILNNQESKFGLKLSDLMLGGAELATGNPIGAVVTVAAKKALTSTIGKTTTAVGLNEVNKFIDKIPAKYFDTAGKISRTALIRALSEITK
jgi:hypothetical protein